MIASRKEHGELDWDELREDLLDHYGEDIVFDPMMPMAVIDVARANEDELVQLAEQAGIDIENYRE